MNGFCRVKLFPPNVDFEGHKTKYWQPKGSRAHLYILPPVTQIINNPYAPLYFTEGEKKAAKANGVSKPDIKAKKAAGKSTVKPEAHARGTGKVTKTKAGRTTPPVAVKPAKGRSERKARS